MTVVATLDNFLLAPTAPLGKTTCAKCAFMAGDAEEGDEQVKGQEKGRARVGRGGRAFMCSPNIKWEPIQGFGPGNLSHLTDRLRGHLLFLCLSPRPLIEAISKCSSDCVERLILWFNSRMLAQAALKSSIPTYAIIDASPRGLVDAAYVNPA